MMHLKRHRKVKDIHTTTAQSPSKFQSSNIHVVTVEKWPCHLCAETFTSKTQLLTHVKSSHHGTWLCPSCHKSFKAKSALIEHMRKDHDQVGGGQGMDRVFSLLKDPAWQKSRRPGEDDIRIVEMEKWLCHICDKSFKEKNILSAHLKAVHLGKWLCHFCDESFTDKECLVMHLKTHSESDGKRPNIVVIKQPEPKTDYNPSFVSSKQPVNIVVHGKKAVRPTGRQTDEEDVSLLKCPVCYTFFNHKRNLKRHLVQHEKRGEGQIEGSTDDAVEMGDSSSDQLFKCNMCDKSFKYKKTLKKHILKHTSQCQFCHEMLETSLLERHVREVHPRGDYLCVICNMKINQKGTFEYHMKHFHDKTKPEKKAKGNSKEKRLRKYMFIPNSEKANPAEVYTRRCEYCLMNIEGSRLQKHIETYHPHGEYVCIECNFLIIARKGQREIYQYHMKSFHDVLEPFDVVDAANEALEMDIGSVGEITLGPSAGTCTPKSAEKSNSGVVITVRAVETPTGKTAVIATTTKPEES